MIRRAVAAIVAALTLSGCSLLMGPSEPGKVEVIQGAKGSRVVYVAPAGSADEPGALAFQGSICRSTLYHGKLVFVILEPEDMEGPSEPK